MIQGIIEDIVHDKWPELIVIMVSTNIGTVWTHPSLKIRVCFYKHDLVIRGLSRHNYVSIAHVYYGDPDLMVKLEKYLGAPKVI